MRAALMCVAVCLATAVVSAEIGFPVDIPTRAKGADKVVIGRIITVQAWFESNSFGDQLIVSHAAVEIEETLKGRSAAVLDVSVEGGTVGDLTLRVSDMPVVRTGERAVFFLDESPGGTNRPHARGLGILKLDSSNRVQGSALTLEQVKQMVQTAIAAK